MRSFLQGLPTVYTPYDIIINMDSPKIILITDDETDFLEIFSEKLASLGYTIATATSGEECIAQAKTIKPNLILLDVQMPGMDGHETFLKLRQDPETASIKVIFVSNLGDPRDGETDKTDDKFAQEAGAAGFVRKTDDLSKLVEEVKERLAA